MTRMQTLPVLALATLLLGGVGRPADEPAVWDDGPWIDVPAGAQVYDGPLTENDLLTLANLDGDPTVLSDEEREMLSVLGQVLLTSPLETPSN